jgi:hypothetical protein
VIFDPNKQNRKQEATQKERENVVREPKKTEEQTHGRLTSSNTYLFLSSTEQKHFKNRHTSPAE